jgi:methylene-fatty-acyl-phospholipid synthase
VPEGVSLDVFVIAATLLSLERISYVWVWRAPRLFQEVCAGPAVPIKEPTEALRALFYGFKALQAGVFVWWCYVHGGGVLWPPVAPAWAVVSGAASIAVGQALNVGVFYRLGPTGVFYGNRFGHDIPWCGAFPFSVVAHPQYVGAVLTIWGVFLILRFPHGDWLVLPALETLYYALGARFESSDVSATSA